MLGGAGNLLGNTGRFGRQGCLLKKRMFWCVTNTQLIIVTIL
jgi:hypothetical protein